MAKAILPLTLMGVCLTILTTSWLHAINTHVPSPYMDPKLTTPPGLYVSSLLLRAVTRGGCEAADLRATGGSALAALLAACYFVRGALRGGGTQGAGRGAWRVAHEALNVCLFPPLFFFSGLYYTDVLSTLVVVVAYCAFQRGAGGGSVGGGVVVYGLGVAALVMRQTNVFWVGVFLAGMEWVRACREMAAGQPAKKGGDEEGEIGWIERFIRPYVRGELHDPALEQAGPMDFFYCLVSIGVSAISHPILLISRLWPYIALLVSFGGFVVWNGGVVLGDKSNHIATIHLTQMLYLWPFITFFSFPLLLPTLLSARAPKPTTLIWTALATALSLAIVHLNTLVHSFTLADNRHYMFYVFRYTILRHPLAKYALVPIYIVSAALALRALSSPATPRPTRNTATRATQTGTAFTLIWLIATGLSLVTAPLVEPRYFILPWVMWRLHVRASRSTVGGWSVEGVKLWGETAWFLAVNAGTCAVFLGRGFEWASEPGRVQRFMW
ncbi:hypothetical protein VE00_10472 [Pseudogymnoascus sp. WSF 3629]|nr:hypothetical protein VE00_10472 [Pseudogymnoascus sp. WSF 3629]